MTNFALGRWPSVAIISLLAACAPACGRRPPEVAPPVVKPGPMPEGGDWTGVYASASQGDLHIIVTDQRADGAWRTPDGAYGTLWGEVVGNEIRYAWRERRRNARGYPTPWFGRGYVVYEKRADSGADELHGEWGLDWSEVGKPWTAVKRPGQEPNIEALAKGIGEETDNDKYDDEYDDGFDDEYIDSDDDF